MYIRNSGSRTRQKQEKLTGRGLDIPSKHNYSKRTQFQVVRKDKKDTNQLEPMKLAKISINLTETHNEQFIHGEITTFTTAPHSLKQNNVF